MHFQRLIRTCLGRQFTGASQFVLENNIPPLEKSFQGVDELGLYLHVPFCRQICPYCPYNKELYHPDTAQRYARAVKREIDIYSDLVGQRPVTSFYIGGGTPTTMLHCGLEDILEHAFRSFNMQCDVHMESHPNDLSADNLDAIAAMGVQHLSIGVEALQDHHLRTLQRPYTAKQARAAIERAVHKGFKCVNTDILFALPRQTNAELEQAANALVEMGVDQVAAYSIFTFPYTRWGQIVRQEGYGKPGLLKRRRMLRVLEDVFYGAGFERTSVWAFTRRGVPKYSSVAVPLYVGLGAGGGSYLRDVFYLNTFGVRAYIDSLERGEMPIALSLNLSKELQMAGWLYWRIYETRFKKSDFTNRFGRPFNQVYGKHMKLLALLGFLEQDGEDVVLSDDGSYWLHAIQDLISINYISTLWGISQQEPWPERVVL